MKNGIRATGVFWKSALFWLILICLAGCGAHLAGCPAGAATPQDSLQYLQPAPLPTPSTGGMLLRLALSLIMVIGLILVLVKLLQRSTLLSGKSAWAKVVDQVVIGPNKMLVLVEIFGKIYVLGVTDHNISTLLGENDIDLSQLRQAVADAERKRAIPSYFRKTFRQIWESKRQEL